MKRHVLVTGGAGFIGSHLVERLLQEGRRVTVIDDLSTGTRENLASVIGNPDLRFIQAKVSECSELAALSAESESIYHLAATVGVDLVVKEPIRTLRTNLLETEIMLEAASARGTRVLLTSTSEVYGKSPKPVFAESDDLLIGPPHLGRWRYACSKLMDEFLALAYAEERKLPVVIARLFNTVGPRQTGRYGMVLPRLIAAAKTGQPLRVFGDGSQKRCFCYVLDTVEALVRLQSSSSAQGGVFNVGATEEISIKELAELVRNSLHSDSVLEFIPYDRAYAPGFEDMQRRKPLTDKLEATVNFRPQTPLARIIELTAASM
jgi:UDP-glucose 4-epimerase